MNTPDKNLLDMARRMQRNAPGNTESVRETLEANLLPMIRCALRSGIGHPSIVRWVRHEVASNPGPASDLTRAARPMARTLSERILERIDPLSGRETVAEATASVAGCVSV